MSTYEQWLEDQLQDPAFAEAWEDLREWTDLKDRLVARRKELGLRQKDVARRVHVSQSTISEFENSSSEPHLSTLQGYARAVGLRIFMDAAAPLPQTSATAPARARVEWSYPRTVVTGTATPRAVHRPANLAAWAPDVTQADFVRVA